MSERYRRMFQGIRPVDWAIAGAPKPVTVANSAEAAAAALGLA